MIVVGLSIVCFALMLFCVALLTICACQRSELVRKREERDLQAEIRPLRLRRLSQELHSTVDRTRGDY